VEDSEYLLAAFQASTHVVGERLPAGDACQVEQLGGDDHPWGHVVGVRLLR
jgi:hypothetical protein